MGFWRAFGGVLGAVIGPPKPWQPKSPPQTTYRPCHAGEREAAAFVCGAIISSVESGRALQTGADQSRLYYEAVDHVRVGELSAALQSVDKLFRPLR